MMFSPFDVWLFVQVTGKALKDSIQIVSSFPEMEKAYSQLKTLSYEVVVDVVPELKWNPENGYKDMKVVVELGDEIDAKKACERQLRQKYKSLGALKIVTDRGLEVTECMTCACIGYESHSLNH